MQHFRITKYDPALRDPSGAFCGDDWTSISDIGKSFGGSTLTVDSYRRVESLYVHAFVAAVRKVRPRTLVLTEIERCSGFRVSEEVRLECQRLFDCVPASDGEISLLGAARFVKAALRELAWGKITSSGGFYVHFGYDYYMYIGDEGGRLDAFRAEGLFTESFPSPYGGSPGARPTADLTPWTA